MDFDFLNSDFSENFSENFIEDLNKKYSKEDNSFDMKINTELKKQFNIKCIQNGTSMSKVLKDYIREYIKR